MQDLLETRTVVCRKMDSTIEEPPPLRNIHSLSALSYQRTYTPLISARERIVAPAV